jgi:hypothetical protein
MADCVLSGPVVLFGDSTASAWRIVPARAEYGGDRFLYWACKVFYVKEPCDVVVGGAGGADAADNAQVSTSGVLALKQGLYLVQNSGLGYITSTVWRHDSDLGRGYLLLSDAAARGRVWRWEVGGGPIAIGKTLHLDDSGCRSNHYRNCPDPKATTSRPDGAFANQLVGSGGLAMDFGGKDHPFEGSLVVAEWGEGRIVRLEDNGARTPLMLQIPDVCQGQGNRRLERPHSLMYAPFGDLLAIDYMPDCQQWILMQLPQAVHTKPLESLQESRQAHTWTDLPADRKTNVLIRHTLGTPGALGSLGLAPDWMHAYVSAILEDGSLVLLKIPLSLDDDDDDNVAAVTSLDPVVAFNHTELCGVVHQQPGPIAVSRTGLVFWAVASRVWVVDVTSSTIVGAMMTPDDIISLTQSDDSYLYLASRHTLWRLRVRIGPNKMPTNRVARSKKK